jgi:hypothetical protein
MQPHFHGDVALASVPVFLGLAKLAEFLLKNQPILASLSYIVAIIAGVVTIYFKFRNKG